MFGDILVILKLGKAWGCVVLAGFQVLETLQRAAESYTRARGKRLGELRRGFATAREARKAAEAKGWDRITGGVSKNQDVFTDGRYYYTRDIDQHSGGAWKMFSDKKCENRIATLDRDLNVIGK
jgi:hypothetical protein